MRILKIAAAGLIALTGLLAFVNNLFNLPGAHAAVSAVISAPEQPYYQVIGPTFGAAWQGWLGLAIIMAGELTAGVLGLMGMLKMLGSRNAAADGFRESKSLAIAGGAVGMLVWYGFFIGIGELYFNMWQTEVGVGSAQGAFRYGTVCAVAMLFLASRDD